MPPLLHSPQSSIIYLIYAMPAPHSPSALSNACESQPGIPLLPSVPFPPPFLTCLSCTTPFIASASPPQSQPSTSPDISSTHSHYGISRTASSHPCPRPSSIFLIRLGAHPQTLPQICVSFVHTMPATSAARTEKGGGSRGRGTRDIIYVLVNYYVHPTLSIFMRCYVGYRECLRHLGSFFLSRSLALSLSVCVCVSLDLGIFVDFDGNEED
jgi:hypothetical protein